MLNIAQHHAAYVFRHSAGKPCQNSSWIPDNAFHFRGASAPTVLACFSFRVSSFDCVWFVLLSRGFRATLVQRCSKDNLWNILCLSMFSFFDRKRNEDMPLPVQTLLSDLSRAFADLDNLSRIFRSREVFSFARYLSPLRFKVWQV